MVYSEDFRRLVLRMLAKTGSFYRCAKMCGVSSSTVHRWATQTRQRNTKHVRHRKLTHTVISLIQEELQNSNGLTTLGRIQCVLRSKGYPLCIKTVSIAVRKHCKFSRKRASKRFGGNKDAETRRSRIEQFSTSLLPMLSEPQNNLIVSVDECYFSEKVLPLYGYAAQGYKCVVTSPANSWKKRSLLLAVASDGTTQHATYQGSVNKARFFDFIMSLGYPRGTTILLDNVAFHKDNTPFVAKGFQQLFTPPYSPDHNGPVENSFSVIKHAFRSAYPWRHGVDQAIDDAVAELLPLHVANSFQKLRELVAICPTTTTTATTSTATTFIATTCIAATTTLPPPPV